MTLREMIDQPVEMKVGWHPREKDMAVDMSLMWILMDTSIELPTETTIAWTMQKAR